jgi:hypothetical protein
LTDPSGCSQLFIGSEMLIAWYFFRDLNPRRIFVSNLSLSGELLASFGMAKYYSNLFEEVLVLRSESYRKNRTASQVGRPQERMPIGATHKTDMWHTIS